MTFTLKDIKPIMPLKIGILIGLLSLGGMIFFTQYIIPDILHCSKPIFDVIEPCKSFILQIQIILPILVFSLSVFKGIFNYKTEKRNYILLKQQNEKCLRCGKSFEFKEYVYVTKTEWVHEKCVRDSDEAKKK
jgi:hypothetical protein